MPNRELTDRLRDLLFRLHPGESPHIERFVDNNVLYYTSYGLQSADVENLFRWGRANYRQVE